MSDKIYLAKSNRSNPDDVSRVRTLLKKYDVQVVEFTGGAYSHKPLLDCDLLIVVPDLSESDFSDVDSDMWVPLGKGLHAQIEAFINQRNMCDVIIVTHTDEHEILFNGFSDLECTDVDDYINYSICLLNSDGGTLRYLLNNRIGEEMNTKKVSSKTNKAKYLLI